MKSSSRSRWKPAFTDTSMLLRKLILWPQRLQPNAFHISHFSFPIFYFPFSRVFYFHSIFVILPTNEAENVFDYFCCAC